MKRLSKLFLSIFALSLWFMGAYSHADATWMTITLTPWWNVVSTPALLSNISFSNWGDGISFSKLGSGLRVSIVPSIETLKPLEWFLVENTNSSDVDMILTYSDNVPPAEAIFQKNLDLWRNFLGITTNVNPFNNIVWNVNMTMDFTYSSSENLLNSVNSSYAWNQNSSTIVSPQYWEAYWAFVTSNNAIYWWINNKIDESWIVMATLTATQTLDAGDMNKTIYTINLIPSKKSIINSVIITKQDWNKNFDELFANVKAYINNQEVGTVLVKNEKIIILNLNKTVAAWQSLAIDLKWDCIYVWNSMTITWVIEENDVIAVEFSTNYNMWNVMSNYATLIIDGAELNLRNQVTQQQLIMPGVSEVVLLDIQVNSNSELEVIDYTITLTQWEENFNSWNFVDWIITVYVDGEDYEMNSTTFTWTPQHSFIVSRNRPARIRAVASFTENAVDASYKLNLTLNKAKVVAWNNIIPLWISVVWHITNIKHATATIKAATKSAPATESLFANQEQEIARFAIKAEGDNITVKSLEFTVTPSANATIAKLKELLDSNMKLVNVETDEEITATFEDMTNAWVAVKSMSYNVNKDETVNIKVMANISSISEDPTNVMAGTMSLGVTAWTFKTTTTSIKDAVIPTAVNGKTYTFRPTAPEITLAKASDNMFEVKITNKDENDNWIDINKLVFRVRTTAANSDFNWLVCIVDDVNTTTCTAGDTTLSPNSDNFGKSITKTRTTPVTIAENDEVTYYILIDGDYIAPDVLQADISSLSYNVQGEAVVAEKYNVSLNSL